MNKPTDKEFVKQMRYLRDNAATKTADEISADLGIKKSALQKRANRYAIEIKRKKRLNEVNPDRSLAVNMRFVKKMKLAAIAEKFGVSIPTICRWTNSKKIGNE